MIHSSNEQKRLSQSLEHNLKMIKRELGNAGDLIIRHSSIGRVENKFAMVYIKGLVDEAQVNNNILRVLELNKKPIESNLFENIYEEMVAVTEIKKTQDFDQVIKTILSGDTALFLDEVDQAILLGTSGGAHRAIEEPESESVVRGSRSGFVENFKLNVALLRRQIKDPNLRIDMMDVGSHSNQKIAICYVEGQVKPEILDEVVRRLKTI